MNRKISRVLRTNTILYSLSLVAFVAAAIPISPLLAIAEAVALRDPKLAGQRMREHLQKDYGAYLPQAAKTELSLCKEDVNSDFTE